MKFLLIFTKKSVPQWDNCYYDYANIKALIVICKKAYAISCNIEDLAREDNYITEQNSNLIINSDALDEVSSRSNQKIKLLMTNANSLFYRYHSLSKRVVYLFFQFKIHQLNRRLFKYNIWYDEVAQTKDLLVHLLSNCYAEKNKLTTMTQLHIQAYDKIHEKHQKSFKKFNLSTPSKRTARLARTLLDLDRYRQKLDINLHDHPQVIYQYNKFYLDEQIEASPFKISILSYFFGLFNGFSICVFITAIILLAANLKPSNEPLQEKQIVFSNQYRLWKGIGFIILYIWVFAFSFYIFQKKRINYSLIFGYKFQNRDKSISRLSAATFMLLIWSCLFVFYVMDLISIYPAAHVSQNPSYPITIFFPIIIFGVLLVMGILELIFTSRGTLFFLFAFGKVFLTLFGIYQIDFGVVWVTQQIVSLVQLFQNIVYSFCYYSQMLKSPNKSENSCLRVLIISQCLIILIFSIRLIQSLIIAYRNHQFLLTREMARFIRASLYITLAALSIASIHPNILILIFWVILACISGIYSFLVDIVYDWNLIMLDKGKIIRRQGNIFSIKLIYLMVAFNLLARFSFPFYFSLQLIFKYFSSPEVILTLSGVIQLGRRLIWNILRVENEQIKNNYYFQVRTDYQQKQNKILCQLKKVKRVQVYKQDILQKQRSTNQITNLRQIIREKDKMRQQVKQFLQQTDKTLENIEDQAELQIFNLVNAHQN